MTDFADPPDRITIGDLRVHRLGFGTMQLPGPLVRGEPSDPDRARRVLRRVVELGGFALLLAAAAPSFGCGRTSSDELDEPSSAHAGGTHAGGTTSKGGLGARHEGGASAGRAPFAAGATGSGGGMSPTDGGSGAAQAFGAGGGAGSDQCLPACVGRRMRCIDGACKPCGGSGQPCCPGQSCTAHLTCSWDETCACGGPDEACCGGDSCNAGLSCEQTGADPTCTCGLVGASCCPKITGAAATCAGSAVCAGVRCSCIAEIDIARGTAVLVRRVDGTVWKSLGSAFTEVTYDGTRPLVASTVAAGAFGGAGPPIGCAVVDGTVWCFPLDGTLADSTFLGAGLGPADPTSAPVQVVTSPGGVALTEVRQISIAKDTEALVRLCRDQKR